ncbi:MAG: membrane protein insertion efficiency factor YidD [Candidatus Erginobacter occultus]|nr:membrane protein insertion efficiency factor YidD [Candidatus Erginobacter occultus]
MKLIRTILLKTVIGLIRLYQALVSPFFGTRCRFYPSCSEYLRESLQKRGLIKGLGKGLARIARCHPFHPGGYDPVN